MSQPNSSGSRPVAGSTTTAYTRQPPPAPPKTPSLKPVQSSSSSGARPTYIRPATALGGSTTSSSRHSGAPPPMPIARPSQATPLSPHAPTFAPQRNPPPYASTPATPTTPTAIDHTAAQTVPPAIGPPQISCCAIGYEISNLSILTYLQTRNEDATGPPASLYERFLRGVTRILEMPLMIVLPQHTNPLLCVMVFYDQPADLFDIMHFPVPASFLRIRQTHQVPVQGHLRKIYIPRARILAPDLLQGTGELLWR